MPSPEKPVTVCAAVSADDHAPNPGTFQSLDIQRLIEWLDTELRVRLDALDTKVTQGFAAGHAASMHAENSRHRESSQAAAAAAAAAVAALRVRPLYERQGSSMTAVKMTNAPSAQPPSMSVSMDFNNTDRRSHSHGGSGVLHAISTSNTDGFAQSATDIQSGVNALAEESVSPKKRVVSLDPALTMGTDSRPSENVERLRQEFVKSRERSPMLDRVWKVMDDPDSSPLARLWERSICLLIFISIISSFFIALDSKFWHNRADSVFETVVEIIFSAEILLRFLSSPNKMFFMSTPYNLVDILSGLPFIYRMATDFEAARHQGICFEACAFFNGFVPILRLLKLLRRFQQFHLLLKAFAVALEALPIMIFIYVLILMAFTASLFVVDPALDTFTGAWWLAMMSLTTVGYGDVYPSNEATRIVVAFFVFVGSIFMAIPLGIIGNAFNDVWKDRDHILLMQKTRTRLEQAGYSAKDIPTLFNLFDQDRNGQLDLQEFRWMLQGMKLGLGQERVVELYQAFDDDRSGGIDAVEFLKALFPETYYELYGDKNLVEEMCDDEFSLPGDSAQELPEVIGEMSGDKSISKVTMSDASIRMDSATSSANLQAMFLRRAALQKSFVSEKSSASNSRWNPGSGAGFSRSDSFRSVTSKSRRGRDDDAPKRVLSIPEEQMRSNLRLDVA